MNFVKSQKAFTLIELLVVVAIIGILAAVGVVAYNGYTSAAKVSATKANHKMITKMIGAKGIQCNIGGSVDYTDIYGATKKMSCPISIDNFIGYMNQTIYGIKLLSPYGTPNGSWCRVNVTNCSPPGYMSACPSNPDQLGYLSVFKSSSNQIKICSNLEYKSGSIIYLEDIVYYE
jgi:prepilin-type N-terminal cleavage/methylation domain-containing protein|tara:strand:+ start:549 stop:1073 length:525 start_codon:yes stop_codon:yes gene_type:complete